MSIRDYIYQYTQNRANISKGLALYQKGEVQALNVHEKGHEYILSAKVQNEAPMAIADANKLRFFHCTCNQAKDELCPHLVALLRAANESLTPEVVQNDTMRKTVDALCNAWQKPATFGDVRLLPALEYEPLRQRFLLSFQIQAPGSRKYLIKNISAFAKSMQEKALVTYGKTLTLVHDPLRFDAFSQFYLSLIEDALELSRYAAGLLQEAPSFGRYLPLSPNRFAAVFAHHDRHQMPLVVDDEPRTLYNKLPKMDLALTAVGGGYHLSMGKGDLGVPLVTYDGAFILAPQAIYHLTRQESNLITPLIKAFQANNQQRLFLPNEAAKTFLSYVYEPLAQAEDIRLDPQLAKDIATTRLDVLLQLDEPQPGAIRGLLTFAYGNERFNPLQSDPLHLVRDRKEEAEFINALYKWRFSKNEDEWLLVGDEAIYQFFTEGLSELMEKAHVEVEDQLYAKRPRKAGKIRIETAITHGMLDVRFEPERFPKEELMEVLRAWRTGRKWIRLKSGDFLNMDENIEAIDDFLSDLKVDEAQLEEGELQLRRNQVPFLRSLEESYAIDVVWAKEAKQFIHALEEVPDELPLPQGFNGILRPYQLYGYRWLASRANLNIGGILADDMGLGKTIQTLAYILYEHQKAPTKDHLVVVPTSLVYNWAKEAERFTPHLPLVILEGSAEERREKLEKAPQGVLFIVSYAVLRQDIAYLEDHKFGVVIADEAQNAKNSYTKSAVALKSLQAEHAFALTGTPMENALSDLWSLMDFVMPGYLPKRDRFHRTYELPISRYGDSERLDHLRRLVRPFLLRRSKETVLLELPDKFEHTLSCRFSPEEERLYQAQLALSQRTFVEELRADGLEHNRIRILALLTRLRQICCSPALVDARYQGPESKLNLALDLIEKRLAKGHRIVLFSQFTEMLKRIEKRLVEKRIPYFKLTGQTKTAERLERVEAFNHGEGSVFLVSLKAGGVGLNLIGADTVIHYDPWWNQSAENQATDRTHRMGQEDEVTVFRLIVEDTIEEKILALKEKKDALARAVLDGGDADRLTEADLRQLFSLEEAS